MLRRGHGTGSRAGREGERLGPPAGRVDPRPAAAAEQLAGWATVFEEAGYSAVAPGWPDDPDTVEEARAHPEVFAGTTIGQVADHTAEVIGKLERKPAVIGHSFGGLRTQIMAGRGLASSAVSISPAPFRGVLPLPIAALRSSWPVLGNPANRNRAVLLTYEQFRYAGSKNPDRGPMLIVSADNDHTVPWVIANAGFRKQRRNQATTEIVKIPDRGHSLVFDSGWRAVADTALAFVKRVD